MLNTRGADTLRWTGFGGAVLLTAGAWAMKAGAGTPALGAAVAGVGIVVLAWLRLGAFTMDGQWSRRTLVWWCGPLLVAPPLFSQDVFSYLAQGEVAARGLDPNVVSPADGAGAEAVLRVGTYWRETPSPYGPLFGALERTITQLTGGDPVMGIALYRVAAVLGLLLIVWAVPRLAALAGASPKKALWLGVLNPLVLWHLIGGVHNDALMLGLMLAGTVIALDAVNESRWWQLTAGVVVIALGAQIKLPALVALAVVGTALAKKLGGGLIRFAAAGFAMIAAAVVVAVCTSWGSGLGFGWLTALGTSSTVPSWMAPTNWPGFLAGEAALSTARAVGFVLILCAVTIVLSRQLRGTVAAVAALALMMSAIVVLGPVVQPWYLLWAVAPLACLPEHRAKTAAVVAVFALLVPPLAGDFTGRVPQLVLGYALGATAVAAVYLLLRRSADQVPQEVLR